MNPPQPGPSSAPPLGLGLRNNMQPLGSCPPPPPSMLQMQQQYHPLAYRNELYDRTAGYDVPRGGGAVPRNNYYQNQQSFGSTPRYQNLHLDLNRPRCAPNSMRTPRQRSFDDTESYQYYRYQNQNNFAKHDNVYERVREEPAYQNTGSFGAGAGPSNRGLFGRLDVIGHGVGRIERHLSSSCGNIDHYSLGGHYAVLGHSHLGTVGHIRLNQSNNNQPNAGKDTSSVNVKSFFSCLGGENSQSMNNISKNGAPNAPNAATAQTNNGDAAAGAVGGTPVTTAGPSSSTATKITGTIPKIRNKLKKENQASSAEQADGDLQASRVTKPSLQWLLVNKWLPMWVGQTPPDYKFIDFNFMFSRNCDGCGSATNHQELMRLDGQAEMRSHEYGDYIPPAREYPTMNGSYPRVLRNTPQLSRLREHEYENVPVDSPSGRVDYAGGRPTLANTNRARSESPSRSSTRREDRAGSSDPFRNWAFNFEDNSFRPAAGGLPNGIPRPREIRRITDGTFRSVDYQYDNERPGPSREFSHDSPKPTPTIVVNDSGTASTSRSNSASPPKSKESSVSPVQHEKEEVPVSSSSDSENYVMDSIATDGGGPAEESSSSCSGPFVEVAEHAAGGDKDCGKDKEPTSSMETSESSNFEENAAESLASDDDNDNDENIEAI